MAFNPRRPILATNSDRDVQVWELDIERLRQPMSPVMVRTSAKVVLLGDTGVGKSGLAGRLAIDRFELTASSHARRIWTLDRTEAADDRREILLWDLPGQPSYRLVHQLELQDAAAALILFDPSRGEDALQSVRYWVRALCKDEQMTAGAPPTRKLLVAARLDRGRTAGNREQIDAIVRELGFDGYFETSAVTGDGVAALRDALTAIVPWDRLPRTTASAAFKRVRAFVLVQRSLGQLLRPAHVWFQLLSEECDTDALPTRAEFDAALASLETHGLVRRLSFGNFVLIEPAYLDTYASAVIAAARDEPDGLGAIPEKTVLTGRFRRSPDERLPLEADDQALLHATVEDLLRHNLVLREATDTGTMLVFPSELSRTRSDRDLPETYVRFTFEGLVANVFATLRVRLSQSEGFRRLELFKNLATFAWPGGGRCGLVLRELAEDNGSVGVFFDAITETPARELFEQIVARHVDRRAVPGTVQRLRSFVCPKCGYRMNDAATRARLAAALPFIYCENCGSRISLNDEPVAEQAATQSVGTRGGSTYDALLLYDRRERFTARDLSTQLRRCGLRTWLDAEQLVPGRRWQTEFENALERTRTAVVLVGSGAGPWQDLTIAAVLREFIRRGQQVVLVWLPGAAAKPALPPFLRGLTAVDLRGSRTDSVQQLAAVCSVQDSGFPRPATARPHRVPQLTGSDRQKLSDVEQIRLAVSGGRVELAVVDRILQDLVDPRPRKRAASGSVRQACSHGLLGENLQRALA
ncbi:MAG: TIR domain-containing protein [Acidobacteriota bacterium]